MDINIIAIVVICVIGSLCWWVNDMLNKVPVLVSVVKVIIVVVAVILLLQACGIGTGTNMNVHLGK